MFLQKRFLLKKECIYNSVCGWIAPDIESRWFEVSLTSSISCPPSLVGSHRVDLLDRVASSKYYLLHNNQSSVLP